MSSPNSVWKLAVFAIALPAAALADRSGSATLAADSFFNLDTGAAANSNPDIFWSGSALLPQGRAGVYNLGKYGSRTFKSIAASHVTAGHYGSSPIAANLLAAGDVFGIRTNSGSYAKVMVTATNGTSLSLQYTVFGHAEVTGAAGPVPSISTLQNNYSYLLPGVPNYGIAPGSLFIILGSNLSDAALTALQSSLPPGLPTTLNHTTISVNVKGTVTTPALYYTSGSAVGAVLPSNTPSGDGTLTLTYNGQPSAPFPIHVVSSAFGIDTLYGTGTGAGVIEDANFNVFGFNNAAKPNQPIVIWGSGVGADITNDDRTFPLTTNNLTNIPMQVFVGGISAQILYRGRSQYPGVDQVNVVIPPNVTLGCYVSVVVQTGIVVSNAVTLPVSANGGACSEPTLGLTGAQLQTLANKGTFNGLLALLDQQTNLAGTKAEADVLVGTASSSEVGAGYYLASEGSCAVIQHGFSPPFGGPLDAGSIQLTGPAGVINLMGQGGEYGATLPPTMLTSSPGTYTFNGSGGASVGKFQVAISVGTPFSLTNKAALASITRSQDTTLTWSGGFSNGVVVVNGVGPFFPSGSVNFFCYAPASAGQLVIPESILSAFPAGAGNLFVLNTTPIQSALPSGIDFGFAIAGVSFEVPTTFK
jgi:uncharacterized protein (TIGR03437 family)